MTDQSELIERIEKLITDVYRDRSVYPWRDIDRRSLGFEEIFRSRLPDWPLRNQTDIVNDGAISIAFLLHPGHYIGVPTRDGIETRINRLGGACYMALVEISHVGPFVRIRFTRETFDRETGTLGYDEQDAPFRDEDRRFLDSMRTLLEESGMEILSREILDRTVPDVELDVTPIGYATVYHCLFDEE